MKNKIRLILSVIAALLFLVIACLIYVFYQKESQKKDDKEKELIQEEVGYGTDPEVISDIHIPGFMVKKEEEIPLGQGLIIKAIGSYTGAYIEDGSDSDTEDVFAILIANENGSDLQFAEIFLGEGEGAAAFSLSTLPAGSSALILEKSKKTYADPGDKNWSLQNTVFFDGSCSMHEDRFEVSAADGIINVKNIGEAVASNIYVYYKNKVDDIYLGGITYRAKIEGGLAEGEIRQTATMHYRKEDSQLLFVTYGEQ